MSYESPTSPTYEDMDFQALESDPIASQVLQEQAMRYIKEERDPEYNKSFYDIFTGETNADGYLIRKDGSIGPKPSGAFSGKGMEEIEEMTKEALRG